ncbi:uncharacterized protein LOC106467615 isoform X2 [Limulus polyphemus]|nr:uncharacterized protein LOC106467615 isoform X2 [Limulus polyphemus]XP_022251526.1 uncharacterized protein LOC106467615 isoform X2 [Limulus polyphemus]
MRFGDDDSDEDLEALRLAALLSRKKRPNPSTFESHAQGIPVVTIAKNLSIVQIISTGNIHITKDMDIQIFLTSQLRPNLIVINTVPSEDLSNDSVATKEPDKHKQLSSTLNKTGGVLLMEDPHLLSCQILKEKFLRGSVNWNLTQRVNQMRTSSVQWIMTQIYKASQITRTIVKVQALILFEQLDIKKSCNRTRSSSNEWSPSSSSTTEDQKVNMNARSENSSDSSSSKFRHAVGSKKSV